MFVVDFENGAVSMHRGDTGSYTVRASRKSGVPWTENDRMLLTIWDGDKPLLQRIYRLDSDDLGNGVILIEFHNEDTDKLAIGNYPMERRYIINPIWDLPSGGSIPSERVVDALNTQAKIVDGHIVRIPSAGQTTFVLQGVYGEV